MTVLLGELWLRAKLDNSHPIGDTPELRAALTDIFAELNTLRRRAKEMPCFCETPNAFRCPRHINPVS